MPPARPHARRTARQGRGSQAPRGSAALRRAPRSLACSPACPPAGPEPLQPLRAAFLPSALLTSFAATGAGAWQTSTCCWRTPRTETGNPKPVGGNPGGVGRGEGSCWNLSGSTRASSPPVHSAPGPTLGSLVLSPTTAPVPNLAPEGASCAGHSISTLHQPRSCPGQSGKSTPCFLGAYYLFVDLLIP